MASVIAMSCTECEMVQGAEMMLHNPWSMIAGESKDLRKAADHLDQLKENLIGRYEKRLGDRAKIAEMLDDETWLSAEKAVEIGAADRIKAGTPIKMALMSNLKTKHVSPYLIAASADPYASKLQAEIQKHLDVIASLEGEKNNLKLELDYAISQKSETAEKLAAIESDLCGVAAARDEALGKLDRIEKDAARQAALSGTIPVPSALLGDDGESHAGMTAYEKYKAISEPAKRREFFRNNQAAIFQTTPKG
jgi:DNA repair exonuclease SbcCD ATPase subunit